MKSNTSRTGIPEGTSMWSGGEPPAELGVNPTKVGPEVRGVNDPGLGGTIFGRLITPFLHGADVQTEEIEATLCLASLSNLTTKVFDDGVYPYACVIGTHLLSLCLHMQC